MMPPVPPSVSDVPPPLRLLAVEDNPMDAVVLQEVLQATPDIRVELTLVNGLAAALERLGREPADVIVLDLNLPDSQGLETLDRIQQAAAHTPIIVISGQRDPGLGVACVRRGAEEFVPKQEITLLGLSIRYTLERHRCRLALQQRTRELEESEARTRNLIEASPDAWLLVDEQGQICFANPAAAELFAVPVGQMPGQSVGLPLAVGECQERRIPRGEHEHRDVEIRTVKTVWEGKPMLLASLRDITSRKQSEAALRTAEAMLAETARIGRVGGWSFDTRHQEQVWTKEVYRIHEVDFDFQPTVEKGLAFYAPESRPVIAEAVRRAIEEGRPFDVELEFITAKGNRRWVRAVGEADAAAQRVQGFFQDITERKQAELLLAARAALAAAAVSGSVDEVMQIALDKAEGLTGSRIGFFHFVNDDQENLTLTAWSTNTTRRMCTAKGKGTHYPISQAGVWADCFYSRLPMIHNDYARVPNKKGMPPGHAAVERELVVPVLRGDKVAAILGVGNKPVDYTEEDINRVQALADMAMDLVSRKVAETAVRQAESRYRALFKQMPAGVLATDLETGSHLHFNDRLCQALGYSWAEFTALPLEDLVVPEGLEAARAHQAQVLTQGRAEYENHYRAKGGGLRTMLVTSELLELGDGKVIQSVFQDITERRSQAAERERLIEELKAALTRVKLLSGLLPTCAGCKKIRDERDRWVQMEAYIQERSEAKFSHGLCPDCLRRMYPEVASRIAGQM